MSLKRSIWIFGSAMALCASSAAFAQTAAVLSAPSSAIFPGESQPLTRTDVRQQFLDLWAVGYDPQEFEMPYPLNVQEAQRRLACKRALQRTGATESEWRDRCGISIDP